MSTSNNAINNTVGASISGVTNTLTITNPSNTASSAARTKITVGGGTAADPSLNFNVSGVTDWEVGIDNNDSDKFKLSQNAGLGTNDSLVCDVAGNITFPRTCGFGSYASVDTANVTGDTTAYQVIFDTEIFDINGDYDHTTGTFTAPVDGHYQFHATVLSGNNGAGHNFGNIQFIVNGTDRYLSWTGSPGKVFSVLNLVAYHCSNLIFLNAADTCHVRLQVGGSTKTISVSGINSRNTFFSGMLAF